MATYYTSLHTAADNEILYILHLRRKYYVQDILGNSGLVITGSNLKQMKAHMKKLDEQYRRDASIIRELAQEARRRGLTERPVNFL